MIMYILRNTPMISRLQHLTQLLSHLKFATVSSLVALSIVAIDLLFLNIFVAKGQALFFYSSFNFYFSRRNT